MDAIFGLDVPWLYIGPICAMTRDFWLIRIVLWFGVLGMALYLLGLLGWLKLYQTSAVLAAIGYISHRDLLHATRKVFTGLCQTPWWILSLVSVQWLVNFSGVFVPEVSFDAVWYHLPFAQVYATTGTVARIPELIYSTMPRLGDLYYTVGFLFHSPMVVKLISYLAALLYVVLATSFAHRMLPRKWAYLALVTFGSFGVLAWQSTTGYVDIFRGVFEVASILILLAFLTVPRRDSIASLQNDETTGRVSDVVRLENGHSKFKLLLLAGMLVGLALGVKMQGVSSLIAGAGALLLYRGLGRIEETWKSAVVYVMSASVIACPWYLDNFLQTGNPVSPLIEIGVVSGAYAYVDDAGILVWWGKQLASLPTLLWKMAFPTSGILTPLVLLFVPVWLVKLWKSPDVYDRFFLLYSLFFLVVWWCSPPPENRMILGLMPILVVMCFRAVSYYFGAQTSWIGALSTYAVVLVALLHLGIRSVVMYQNLPVILGVQEPAYYVQSKTDDFNRDVMERYYSGYWSSYAYH